MPRWEYDVRLRRYRNLDTGRIVKSTTIRSWRDVFIVDQTTWAETLVASLAEGTMTVQAFELEMRARIKRTYVTEYLLGRGGTHAMTVADRNQLGVMLNTQYDYLHRFAEALAAGDYSEEYARNRASMYFSGATQAHEFGRAQAHGLSLPAYPGDGSTECLSRCRCSWRIIEKDAEWRCTWVVNGASESCPDCLNRGQSWAPFVVAKES